MDVSSGPHGGLVLCLGLLLAPKNHQSRAALSRVRSRTRDIRTDFDVKLRSPLGTAFSRLGRPSLACVGRRNRASSRKISAICRAAIPRDLQAVGGNGGSGDLLARIGYQECRDDVRHRQRRNLGPAQSAAKQHGDDGAVALALPNAVPLPYRISDTGALDTPREMSVVE